MERTEDGAARAPDGPGGNAPRRLVTDGGSNDGANDESEGSNVDVKPAGEAEPAELEWVPPDLDDVPDFEVRADEPVAGAPSDAEAEGASDPALGTNPEATPDDPTAGMPHDAQAPGATAVSGGGAEAYVAALELCARLPDDVRLPEEAADLVPAAVEAELEQAVQQFTAAEFDNARPHVDVLAFDEVDDEVWLRIRIGVPTEDFDALDPDRLREYALQQLEGVF